MLSHPSLQRQAKRRYLRLTEEGITMLDLMTRDVAAIAAPKCCAPKKHGQGLCGNNTCMALLSCNNHYKAYAKWGEVQLKF